MAYYVDIFSVETYEAFSKTDKSVIGFMPGRLAWVKKIKPGDKILCYVKGLSTWVGLLEVTGPLVDRSASAGDPDDNALNAYTLQFPGKALHWFDKGQTVPIKRPDVWETLSFTKNIAVGAGGWNAGLRSSGVRFPDADGVILEQLLTNQTDCPEPDGFSEDTWNKHRSVKVPDPVTPKPNGDEHDEDSAPSPPKPPVVPPLPPVQARTSHKMQAMLADIGIAMGFQVWIPKSDKEAVIAEMKQTPALLQALPYAQFSEPAVLKTVEQIDVLWLQKKTIARAFEVEHTTSVFSGILRMADLLALQPNFHTKLHLVAPVERRTKVFQELRRPAFSMYKQGKMYELCTYLPYEKVEKLAANPYLEHMKEDVLDKFEEYADQED